MHLRVYARWDTIEKFFFSFSYITPSHGSICCKIVRHIFFQLLDTLPVCQDFNRQVCNRPACKFIHLSDGEFVIKEISIFFEKLKISQKSRVLEKLKIR